MDFAVILLDLVNSSDEKKKKVLCVGSILRLGKEFNSTYPSKNLLRAYPYYITPRSENSSSKMAIEVAAFTLIHMACE